LQENFEKKRHTSKKINICVQNKFTTVEMSRKSAENISTTVEKQIHYAKYFYHGEN